MTKKTLSVPWRSFVGNVLDMLYPELCQLCENPLSKAESLVCHDCLYHLPRIHYTSFIDNEVAELFYGKVPFVKAGTGLRYIKDSPIQLLIERLKYKGIKELGAVLGSFSAAPLHRSGFFNDIDVLIPVPLHPHKLRVRGYNQSEWIAKGLSTLTGLPIDTTSLRRSLNNSTQTRKPLFERWENVSSVFELHQAAALENKHLLLIDDVLTSGSTLNACACEILKAKGSRVSLFALAKA